MALVSATVSRDEGYLAPVTARDGVRCVTGAVPSPAGSVATEDEGQPGDVDRGAQLLVSDIPPAGHATSTPRDTPVEGASAGGKRTSHLDVRITPAERDAIQRRAHVLGVTPSGWARAVLRDALDARRDVVEALERRAASRPRPHPMLADAVTQTRRVGVTLNGLLREVYRARRLGEEPGVVVDDDLLQGAIAANTAVRAALGDRTST
ncbi:hypothetical protein JRG19_03210 [Pseudoclavibacter alba]|uniref:plasmid mobilization protein n=1 Tax=Pseudoclavibacter albus TaxID=272241 RepID=UPI0019D1AE16|nr:hypothetical protein [Pseudoclavibacter alba]